MCVCVCHILSCCRPVLSMAVKSPRGLLTSHVLIFRVSGSIASCYSLRQHDDKVETCVCLPREMQQYAHVCEHPWTHRNKCTQFCKEYTYTRKELIYSCREFRGVIQCLCGCACMYVCRNVCGNKWKLVERVKLWVIIDLSM